MTSRSPAPARLTARAATTVPGMLSEGPVWDAEREQFLWVDILAAQVISGRLRDDGTIEEGERLSFAGSVGAVAPASGGGLLVALADRLVERQPDGTIIEVARLIGEDEDRRLNDGKPDPAGRFCVGTLSHRNGSTHERLVRVEDDGQVRVIDEDLTLSNGLAWSADGAILYSVDTLTRRIHRRSYDAATGACGERSPWLELPVGYPDGVCTDSEDHLWVAVWGRGEVHRYSPAGDLVAIVDVAAPHVSSVAFVGPHLDTLLVTTAREDLSDEELIAHPLSGCLFTAAPGVTGPAPTPWNGGRVLPEGETS